MKLSKFLGKRRGKEKQRERRGKKGKENENKGKECPYLQYNFLDIHKNKAKKVSLYIEF
jgi:hypothetical protein